jgi:hypothetical protein
MNTIKRIPAAIAAAYRELLRVLGGGGSGPPTLPK